MRPNRPSWVTLIYSGIFTFSYVPLTQSPYIVIPFSVPSTHRTLPEMNGTDRNFNLLPPVLGYLNPPEILNSY